MAFATTQTEAFSALAAQDAASAYARAAQLAKSPEQVQREFVAGQRRQIRNLLAQVRSRREWLREAEVLNAGVARFFSDNADIVLPLIRSHRRAIHEARAKLAAMSAPQRKAA